MKYKNEDNTSENTNIIIYIFKKRSNNKVSFVEFIFNGTKPALSIWNLRICVSFPDDDEDDDDDDDYDDGKSLNFIFLTHVLMFELFMYVYSCNALSARFLSL